jgi:hypothetical protein
MDNPHKHAVWNVRGHCYVGTYPKQLPGIRLMVLRDSPKGISESITHVLHHSTAMLTNEASHMVKEAGFLSQQDNARRHPPF